MSHFELILKQCVMYCRRRPVSRGLIHHENVRNLVVCISVGHIRKLWQALLFTNARGPKMMPPLFDRFRPPRGPDVPNNIYQRCWHKKSALHHHKFRFALKHELELRKKWSAFVLLLLLVPRHHVLMQPHRAESSGCCLVLP